LAVSKNDFKGSLMQTYGQRKSKAAAFIF